MRHYRAILLACFLLHALSDFAQTDTVRYVIFQGYKRSRPAFLSRFIATKINQPVDSIQLAKDVQQLLNTELFVRASFEVMPAKEGVGIAFHVKERLTILPLINGGIMQSNFWIELGVGDVHFLGRGIQLGAIYRYYDRHSFIGFAKIPNWRGSRWGSSMHVELNRTLEPIWLKYGEPVTWYNQDKLMLRTMAIYQLGLQREVRLGFSYEHLTFSYRSGYEDAAYPKDSIETQEKYLIRLRYENKDQLQRIEQYVQGWSNRFIGEVSVKPDINNRIFFKLYYEIKGFVRIGKRGNLAGRMIWGLFENHRSPFAPFLQDSFIQLRGIGNKRDRGTAETTFNIEYRHTIFEHKLGAIQLVSFLDFSTLRQPAEEYKTLFNNHNMEFYGGGGIRLFVRKIYGFTLRVDYGISLKDARNGFVLGVGQYF